MGGCIKDHKIIQLKWLYAGLTGACVAYFLSLFSGAGDINSSFLLTVATVLFAVCLPIFAVFTFVHIAIIELTESIEKPEDQICFKKRYSNALKLNWVQRLTTISFILILIAFACLVGYYSLIAMILMSVTTVILFFLLKSFFSELKNDVVKSEKKKFSLLIVLPFFIIYSALLASFGVWISVDDTVFELINKVRSTNLFSVSTWESVVGFSTILAGVGTSVLAYVAYTAAGEWKKQLKYTDKLKAISEFEKSYYDVVSIFLFHSEVDEKKQMQEINHVKWHESVKNQIANIDELYKIRNESLRMYKVKKLWLKGLLNRPEIATLELEFKHVEEHLKKSELALNASTVDVFEKTANNKHDYFKGLRTLK